VAKKTLVVTRRLPEEVEARIAGDYNVRPNTEDQLYTSEQLIQIAQGADALLVTSQDLLNATVISRLPSSVKVIATLPSASTRSTSQPLTPAASW
jgi:lactate dehydrogenase-like 2-hydroxyacid dehydrogenase